MKNVLVTLVDTSKLGGWVRAMVASGLSLLVAHFAVVGDVISPDTATAISIAVSGVVVGVWSHYVKHLED
jgi:hypothetical protein